MIRAADSFDAIRKRLEEIRSEEGRGAHPVARRMSYPVDAYVAEGLRELGLEVSGFYTVSNYAPCDTEADGFLTYSPEDGG